ncbi:Tad domain-containing protein [Alkalicoccus halolimnae]|uniref:Tad domain-containing protein n=1 Tax=Alkalicoccus halolimnae TaxID=1667239 RepID=A0A5C7F5X2_9BACI|nr:Tad domain-containing protein [Alkalicoccus halolimnae]TXF86101.1 hypothetical protein FTX54_05650 [Alkalicoccus halolimnae]
MWKQLKNEERGNIIVIFAFALSMLMGFAAIAVDAGQLYFEKSNLQKTVDAAALAGAHAYYSGDSNLEAQEIADLNGFQIAGSQITVENGRVTVQHESNVPLSFARMIGINDADVFASSTAATGALGKGDRIAPIAIEESEIPDGKYLNCAKPEDGGNCGYLTGNGTGASSLNEALVYGKTIEIGTYELETEPGAKVGQVRSAVDEIISKDSGNNKCDSYSTADASCYRVITVAVTESGAFSDASGRDHVNVLGFASYWVEGFTNQGGNSRIVGHYIDMVRLGELDPNAKNYGSHVVKLME